MVFARVFRIYSKVPRSLYLPTRQRGPTRIVFASVSLCILSLWWHPQALHLDTKDFNETSKLKSTIQIESVKSFEVGNSPMELTEEQQLKLQQLWEAVFSIFGINDGGEDGGDDTLAPSQSTNTSATDAGKNNKKKFLGLGKKKDKSDSTGPSRSATFASDTGDDKYGLNKDFKVALQDQSPEEIRETFWRMVKADHPDALLLRFLRARKWDIQKALVMLISTLHWRLKEMDTEAIMLQGEEGALQKGEDGFMFQIRKGKSFLHGLDKLGRPITVVRARLHHSSDQALEDIEKYTIWTMETARLMLDGSVDTATIIFDLSGFQLSNMDYSPVKFLVKCFEAHYPESLGAALVYKAPWIFQGIWKIIRGWLDPVVASKIHFVNSVDGLAEFIEPDKIIKELGGPYDWEYKYIEPKEGENEIMKDEDGKRQLQSERADYISEFEALTKTWIADSTDETSAKDKRHVVAKQLRENYWNLDPYLRARSIYDRNHSLGPRGGFVYTKET